MDKEGNHLKNNVLRDICHNPAHPVCKQALFAIKRSLLYNQNKPCLQPKEALFANHCCSVKKLLATGSAKRDLYAKPTASRKAAQLWVGRDARAVPRRGTYAIGCQQDV